MELLLTPQEAQEFHDARVNSRMREAWRDASKSGLLKRTLDRDGFDALKAVLYEPGKSGNVSRLALHALMRNEERIAEAEEDRKDLTRLERQRTMCRAESLAWRVAIKAWQKDHPDKYLDDAFDQPAGDVEKYLDKYIKDLQKQDPDDSVTDEMFKTDFKLRDVISAARKLDLRLLEEIRRGEEGAE